MSTKAHVGVAKEVPVSCDLLSQHAYREYPLLINPHYRARGVSTKAHVGVAKEVPVSCDLLSQHAYREYPLLPYS